MAVVKKLNGKLCWKRHGLFQTDSSSLQIRETYNNICKCFVDLGISLMSLDFLQSAMFVHFPFNGSMRSHM